MYLSCLYIVHKDIHTLNDVDNVDILATNPLLITSEDYTKKTIFICIFSSFSFLLALSLNLLCSF